MESDRDRARRLLAAVRSLPPGVLDVAAANAPAESATLIAAVRTALAAPDPEAALVCALEGIALPSAVVAEGRSALDAAARLPVWETARATLELALARRDQLAGRGASVRDALAADSPALAALTDEALAMLGDEGPLGVLKSTLVAVRELQRGLAEVAAGKIDGGDLARLTADLRTQRDALVHARAQLARLPELVAEARSFLEERGDLAGVARLAALDATLHDREPGSEARWQDALDRAVTADQLPVARDAAKRIARAALENGTYAQAAAAAGRVVELAVAAGDLDAELDAVGDQALALARLPDGADRARELVTWAGELAHGDPARTVRARLLEGLVIERLGDEGGARRAYRKVMDAARDLDGVRQELGWAALHLGQLEASAGQRFRAGQDLEVAQELGRALGDALLFASAADARLELAEDRPAAEAVLGDLGGAPPAVQDVLRRRLDERWPAP